MILYAVALLTLTTLYAAALFKLRAGLARLKKGTNQTQPSVSVIVAARNEERNISTCLTALLKQTYPADQYDVLVVDDRSSDDTARIVRSFCARDNRITLLQVEDKGSDLAPKKRAIDLGIRHAKGEIIVTTDADCEPGPRWLSGLMRHFEPKVGMVCGFNPYYLANSERPFFHNMLALDYFAMACVAAASSGLGYPISCTGGNLAYRKQTFRDVGGFQALGTWVSGDDDFFLQHVRETTKWQTRYATEPETFVPTAPPSDLRTFFHQRLRYASKGRHYSLPVTISLIGVYLLNLGLVLGPILALQGHPILWPWMIAFLLKLIAEYIFLRTGGSHLQFAFDIRTFFVTEMLHPIYLIVVGLLGQFARFEWKEEKYTATTQRQRPPA